MVNDSNPSDLQYWIKLHQQQNALHVHSFFFALFYSIH